jgi:hypothetical protein
MHFSAAVRGTQTPSAADFDISRPVDGALPPLPSGCAASRCRLRFRCDRRFGGPRRGSSSLPSLHSKQAFEIATDQPVEAEIVTIGELQKGLIFARQRLRDLIV